ncbi:methyltransferase [Acinetobacter sp. c3-l95]|uniref:methyltransferase n=1 Tax=Acinetobacter sp. c3-l95 TaxID=3342804 RepID=UPI0035B9563C
MDAKSQVVLRQAELMQGRVLLTNPPSDDLAITLLQHNSQSVAMWCWNHSDYQYLNRLKTEKNQQQLQSIHFDILPPVEHYDNVIIFVPKAKALLHYIIHQLIQTLDLNSNIYLVGEKNAGIEGSSKQLKDYGKVFKIDSARHCQLWQFNFKSNIKDEFKYQAEQYGIQDYDLNLKDFMNEKNIQLNIQSMAGVFSQNRLDIGTAQLLPFLNQVKSGKILDFGCGSGIMGLILAKLNPNNHIVAVDVDAFALHSTRLNFEKHGLSQQLTTIAITDIQNLSQQAEFQHAFDVIISNPPFHQGVKTDYQASENLCEHSKKLLNNHGELWLVFNDFLNYPNLLKTYFSEIIRHHHKHGFLVISAK